jgi:hypothetical protein
MRSICVKVINSVNELAKDELVGEKMGDVRSILSRVLNLHPRSTSTVDGVGSTPTYLLKDWISRAFKHCFALFQKGAHSLGAIFGSV